MKKLLTIAAILTLSGTAYAEFEGNLDMEWINSIGTSQSQTYNDNAVRSQPEVGSTSTINGLDFSNSVSKKIESLIHVNEH